MASADPVVDAPAAPLAAKPRNPAQKVSKARPGAGRKAQPTQLVAAPSLKSFVVFVVVFLAGFTAFAFALDVFAQLMEVVYGGPAPY